MPHIDKLKSLGIPVVYTAEYLEPHPLGRAEWIKFFATFFDKARLADTIFSKIEQEYLNIKAKSSIKEHKPQILLNTPFEGIWYLPGTSSYIVQLINDAGGKYIFDTLQSKDIYPMNIEWVIHNAQNADVWLNTGLYARKEELQNESFKLIKAYRNNKIFNHIKTTEHNGSSKFWEQGVVEPHIILQDLYNIFHNDSVALYHYYKKL
jgi:iron complex transport system substrate-binding protein